MMGFFSCDIIFMDHTDRIEIKRYWVADEFFVGDDVISPNNGLTFKVENKKMLNLMKLKNEMLPYCYVKIIKEL